MSSGLGDIPSLEQHEWVWTSSALIWLPASPLCSGRHQNFILLSIINSSGKTLFKSLNINFLALLLSFLILSLKHSQVSIKCSPVTRCVLDSSLPLSISHLLILQHQHWSHLPLCDYYHALLSPNIATSNFWFSTASKCFTSVTNCIHCFFNSYHWWYLSWLGSHP